ncbi:methionine--tRNA ligase [Candidatus Saccharibacteria bacterium]|nr:methionine--tRNA ligase [Candidatus Saccharibacteria bacterium]
MKQYITTAIPYVNGPPHIGHAMDYLLADVWARYQAQQGHEVRFSAGTDEHGTKVANIAAENQQSPQEFVDALVPEFQTMIEKMNVSVTDFVRTTNPDHVRRVQEIWRRLDAAGLIYRDTYTGWYCSGCEAFIAEAEAREADYVCANHQKPLDKIEEENYFLRVSKFTKQIREFAAHHIVPEFRGREILELICDGAQDVSISRPQEKLAWGIPVPGDESQTMYVWIDALSNYITALGYPDDDWSKGFWPANVEVIGKDILRFHAIIWPAILLGLGLELPETLLAHGFVNVDGTKMSKSLGNVIAPDQIIDKFGVDAFRYFFLRHIPTFDDGDYTEEKFLAAYNNELANDLGNLVSRTAKMVQRFANGSTSDPEHFSWDKSSLDKYMTEFRYDLALENIWGLVQHLNRYIDEKKPWELAKKDTIANTHNPVIESTFPVIARNEETKQSSELEGVMSYLVAGLRLLGDVLTPFLPDTATKITEIFGGESITTAPILFPKIEK